MNNSVVTVVVADANSTLRETWFLIPNWKWIGLVSAILIGVFCLNLLKPVLSSFRQTFKKQVPDSSFFAYLLAEPIHRPISWILTCLLLMGGWQALELPENLEKSLRILTQIILSVAVMRLAYMFIEALGHKLEILVKKTESSLDDQLAPFATKTLKVLVFILGGLVILQNFGVNVMSLLAGLGLGGLALALAAQDTVANLFGSITIILDRPFQVGDLIKVTDTEGTVEEVGFRSTRIRTNYQSVVSIPNAIMAKEKIDNMGVRPRRRVRHMIGLEYSATEAQIKQFIDRVRYSLTQNPTVYQEDITVIFQSYGDFSQNILVNCFVVAPELKTELEIQQQILFDIRKCAEESQVGFAFPTQTVHVSNLKMNS